MRIQFTRLIPVALICLVVASCKKNDEKAPSSALSNQSLLNTANLVDMSLDEITSSDWEDDEDAVVAGGPTSNNIVSGGDVSNDVVVKKGCRKVTYSPDLVTFPHTKIVDYGTGCTNGNGTTRSGQQIYITDANWKTAPNGTRIGTMTFNNFKVNGLTITGNVVSTVVSGGGTANVRRRQISQLTYRDALGNTSTYVGIFFKTITAGFNTKAVKDDVYQITGGANGVEVHRPVAGELNNVATWSTTIAPSNPVIKNAACEWKGSGVVDIIVNPASGGSVFEKLDYGSGSCDNSAVLTIPGVQQNVTLPVVFYNSYL